MPNRSHSRSRSPARRRPDERRARSRDADRSAARRKEDDRRHFDDGRAISRHEDEAKSSRREDGRNSSKRDEDKRQPARRKENGKSNGREGDDRESARRDGDRQNRRVDEQNRKPRPDDREDRKPRPDDREDRKPRFDDREDRKPRFDDREDRKPRFDDREDRKPRFDDREDRKPRFDDREDRKPRFDDRDRKRRRDDGGRKFEWGKADQRNDKSKEPEKPKEKANMGLSGKLAEDTNMYKGVLIKYSQPANARIPIKRWRLYPFKGDEALKPLYVHRQSGYLIGRDRKIADIPFDHPSISKQHAVLQYRQVEVEVDGSKSRVIKPYIIDLESPNGTFLNGSRIDARRYVELKETDVLKFGYSTREYVVLSENADRETTSDVVPPSDSESEGD